MEKLMKNKLKSILIYIVGLISGILITSGLVYAVILFEAIEVEYDNSNSGSNSKNVQQAIDELYDLSETHIPDDYVCVKSTGTFSNDSWETIASAVKSGHADIYKVGDTKEVEVNGYGTFTVRVANNTTPEECNTAGFSQTACGFVVEFFDLITKRAMNSSSNIYGWQGSEMRTWLNTTIYNALPEELRNVIIETYVISGHGTNYKIILSLKINCIYYQLKRYGEVVLH